MDAGLLLDPVLLLEALLMLNHPGVEGCLLYGEGLGLHLGLSVHFNVKRLVHHFLKDHHSTEKETHILHRYRLPYTRIRPTT